MEDASQRSDSANRRAIRRQWEADGQPPCPVCRTSIADDEVSVVSQILKAVVHRLCSTTVGASGIDAEKCATSREALDSDGDDFCVYPRFCRCPFASAVNLIVFARRIGLPVAEVPTADSPGCARAAREVGLGSLITDVPLREILKYRPIFVRDEAVWDRPTSWYEPPGALLVDVVESFRAGRITAYAGDDIDEVRAMLDSLLGAQP